MIWPGTRATRAAAELLLEALEIAAELDSRYLLPGCWHRLRWLPASAATWSGRACLLGASQAHYEAAGLVPDPVDADDLDRMKASARDRLGADRFARLWSRAVRCRWIRP